MLSRGQYLGDRYEILDRIGAGGMSDVYKAKDHILGRDVAIKVLKSEFANDATFVTKFRTEAQSAAGLEHANIVNIYDVGNTDDLHYIVMEYIEGVTLKTYIEKKEQLNYKEVISIAIQVGRGIEAAHRKKIIHRDIKPQNVMISVDGKVKVTDFGIARAVSSNTIRSDVMVSVHYASPEQTRNELVGVKSDIYSLGIVMYEMATGRLPYDGDNTVAVALAHLQEDMVEPSLINPDIPVSLEKIILKCTMKNVDKRYEMMEDVLIDLKRALVNPDEDFVEIVDDDIQATRIISGEEQEELKNAAVTKAKKKLEPRLAEYEDDDEDDGDINPKLDKAITIMAIAAGVVIVSILVFIVGSAFNILPSFGTNKQSGEDEIVEQDGDGDDVEDNSSEETISVPNVVGMTRDYATTTLENEGFEVRVRIEKDEEVPEGQVISQSPTNGSQAKKGDKITISVAAAVDPVVVPDVVNMSEAEATAALEEAGFHVDVRYDSDSSAASGTVISQDPAGNNRTVRDPGSTITITVSGGSGDSGDYHFSYTWTNNGSSTATVSLVGEDGRVIDRGGDVAVGESITVSGDSNSPNGNLIINYSDGTRDNIPLVVR